MEKARKWSQELFALSFVVPSFQSHLSLITISNYCFYKSALRNLHLLTMLSNAIHKVLYDTTYFSFIFVFQQWNICFSLHVVFSKTMSIPKTWNKNTQRFNRYVRWAELLGKNHLLGVQITWIRNNGVQISEKKMWPMNFPNMHKIFWYSFEKGKYLLLKEIYFLTLFTEDFYHVYKNCILFMKRVFMIFINFKLRFENVFSWKGVIMFENEILC